jgi:hypothetical protein
MKEKRRRKGEMKQCRGKKKRNGERKGKAKSTSHREKGWNIESTIAGSTQCETSEMYNKGNCDVSMPSNISKT